VLGRIIEVADDHRSLSIRHGLMIVEETQPEQQELGTVPLDDILAVIVHARGVTYRHSVLVALAERGIPFVICGSTHNPVGFLVSLDGHHQQAHRFEAQIAATKPTHKRLWASLVKAKLAQQAAVLNGIGQAGTSVSALVSQVRSGDPANVEALGARRYWRLLFGDGFRRNRQAGNVNGLLNYGYTVARAATARAVVAAGLHPSIGLHHSHDENAMRLVDDLMEPFRPLVDLQVWRLVQSGQASVTPDTKRPLVLSLYADLQTKSGATPVVVCMQRLATSLAQIYLRQREVLDLPVPGLPLGFLARHPEQP